jgi:hypothetical protein
LPGRTARHAQFWTFQLGLRTTRRHRCGFTKVPHAIPRAASLIKFDLRNVFFQLPIQQQFWKFYGIYYRHQRYAWTRLPMGHPMAPYYMQRLTTAVARHPHQRHGISVVNYLDDWLLYSSDPIPVAQILQDISRLSLVNTQINLEPHTYFGIPGPLRCYAVPNTTTRCGLHSTPARPTQCQ